MNRFRLTARSDTLGLLVLTCFLLLPTAGLAQSGEEVMDRVRSKLSQVEAISAQFDQTFSSDYIEQAESLEGTILLDGDRYRVETPDQTFVTDGRVTWIYNRTENQVLINNFMEDETTFSLNRFLFSFDERYFVFDMENRPDNPGNYRVVLRSIRPDEFFPQVTLTVRNSDYLITRLEVIDSNETRITINLRNVKLNPPVSAEDFTFEPPKASDIVDLRS